MRFVQHHSHLILGPQYTEEDRGYETPCWTWQRRKNAEGYGTIGRKPGGSSFAHRAFYERDRGAIPDGFQLDHLCRNRDCVNPDHLEPVTPQENTRRSGVTKLTVEQVSGIKRAGFGDETHYEIAARFGTSHQNVSNILAGRTWREVEPLSPRQLAALNEQEAKPCN